MVAALVDAVVSFRFVFVGFIFAVAFAAVFVLVLVHSVVHSVVHFVALPVCLILLVLDGNCCWCCYCCVFAVLFFMCCGVRVVVASSGDCC